MSELISTNVWARAKAAYLAGETAGAVCVRFRIGRSAFFEAARIGGWRRADAAGSEAEADAPAPLGEALPCADLAETAMARASDAVMGGRLHEAQGWTRLAAGLRRLALEETGRLTWRETLGAVIDEEAYGRHAADRLSSAPESPAAADSPDSSRTPISVLSRSTKTLIAARPDSADSLPLTGLSATTAMPDAIEDRIAWAEIEIAKLEARGRQTAKAGGP